LLVGSNRTDVDPGELEPSQLRRTLTTAKPARAIATTGTTPHPMRRARGGRVRLGGGGAGALGAPATPGGAAQRSEGSGAGTGAGGQLSELAAAGAPDPVGAASARVTRPHVGQVISPARSGSGSIAPHAVHTELSATSPPRDG